MRCNGGLDQLVRMLLLLSYSSSRWQLSIESEACPFSGIGKGKRISLVSLIGRRDMRRDRYRYRYRYRYRDIDIYRYRYRYIIYGKKRKRRKVEKEE